MDENGLTKPPVRIYCISCRQKIPLEEIRNHCHSPLGRNGVWSTAPVTGYVPPIAVYCDAKGNLIEGDDHD